MILPTVDVVGVITNVPRTFSLYAGTVKVQMSDIHLVEKVPICTANFFSKAVGLPKIVGEMVKPAEKIKSINVNHVTGLGGSSDARPSSPVSTAMDSIMEMAVQMPLLKKIGDQMGVSFDESTGKKDKD